MSVIEIGAHIGYYTTIICDSITSSGKAIFVEPAPENFELLRINLAINNNSWANTVSAAVSNVSGCTLLHLSKDTGRNSLKSSEVTNHDSITVDTITLDELVIGYDFDTVDLLLLDVEGAEYRVLEGGMVALAKNLIHTIMCEFHPQQLVDHFGTPPSAFLTFVRRAGFTIYRLDPLSATEVEFRDEDATKYQHLIFRLEQHELTT
jgi:FkbM family methyltransferase